MNLFEDWLENVFLKFIITAFSNVLNNCPQFYSNARGSIYIAEIGVFRGPEPTFVNIDFCELEILVNSLKKIFVIFYVVITSLRRTIWWKTMFSSEVRNNFGFEVSRAKKSCLPCFTGSSTWQLPLMVRRTLDSLIWLPCQKVSGYKYLRWFRELKYDANFHSLKTLTHVKKNLIY